MDTTTKERPHGYARYKGEGCRCDICRKACSRYLRDRVNAIACGTWKPFVDAEPVRAHVLSLMAAGIGRRRISTLTGISQSTLQKLLSGKVGRPPTLQVRPAMADKLFAITASTVAIAAGANINPIGTQRRIQGLAVLGWTLTEQGRRIGWEAGNYIAILGREQIVRATADKVATLYEQLSMQPAPSGYGATRVKAMAMRRRWFPPLAWDDEQIDDPAAVPVLLPPIAESDPAADEWAIQHHAAGHPTELDMPTRDEIVRRL